MADCRRRRGRGFEEGTPWRPPRKWCNALGFADVLGPRALRALPGLERHGLSLTERVERLARRLMEKVLLARLVGHETEAVSRNYTKIAFDTKKEAVAKLKDITK